MRESLWRKIHQLKGEQLSCRAIAARLGIHRRTVRRALAHEHAPPKGASRRRGSIIDPHRGWLLAKIQQYPELPSARLFHMLKERGYEGGESTVRKTVSQLRPQVKPVYRSLHFEPGECAQVDWGSWQMLDVPGGRRRLSFISIVLCHSRMLYVEFFMGEKTEHWLTAHRNAFEYFGGVPKTVMVDNCRTAVLQARTATDEPQINPTYQHFADHYGFKIIACDPYQPQQKGRTESAVGYVKSAFLSGRKAAPVDVLNPAVRHWLGEQANCRIHGTTKKKPQQVFIDEEKPQFMSLPQIPHHCAQVATVCSNSVCKVAVDTNRYSIGPKYGSRRLILHAYAERIRLYTIEGEFVTEHKRSYGRNQEVIDPQHLLEQVNHNRHAREHQHIKAFLSLGTGAADYLAGLKEKRPDYSNHIKAINSLARIYEPSDVIRAIRDAGEHQAYSADHIENMLRSRSRNPTACGPLHLTRSSDLIDMSIPEPNLDIYRTNHPNEQE
jgi:transposase